ncbi:MAG TPA: patatin family protein [Myxococcales bacterium]|jgi:predicted patatin/cPLA2 family phospholipase
MTGRVAIVVEGGAMRGVFTAGVLDAFLERRFDPFDLALGVSAGACNLASHLAGQHGRNRRSYLELMTRREFIDPWRALRGRSALDLDWLWDALAEREPLDVQALARRTTEFLVVATSRATGKAVYLRPGPAEMFDALKASSAMPILYRGDVTVGGERLVDGGVSDPIPVEEAFRRGARDILVLRTRPADAVKRYDLSARATAWQLRREPGLAAAVRELAGNYQRAVAFMERPPPGCRVLQVAPPVPLATKRTTRDRRVVERDYELGRAIGEKAMAGFPGP